MKPIAIAAAALGIAALGSWSSPANAATCFREIVAGPSGHREMVRGCYTRERIATRAPRRTVTTKTVTTDYYTTSRPYTSTVTRDYDTTMSRPYTRTVTRDASTVPVMRRQQSEEIGYGSSNPEPMRYDRLR